MTRLSTNFVKVNILFGVIFITVTALQQNLDSSFKTDVLYINVVIVIFLCLYYWMYRNFKNVYTEGSKLYISNQFSNKTVEIDREQIIQFRPSRLNTMVRISYKIVYQANNNRKKVYFGKRFLRKDIQNIINKLTC